MIQPLRGASSSFRLLPSTLSLNHLNSGKAQSAVLEQSTCSEFFNHANTIDAHHPSYTPHLASVILCFKWDPSWKITILTQWRRTSMCHWWHTVDKMETDCLQQQCLRTQMLWVVRPHWSSVDIKILENKNKTFWQNNWSPCSLYEAWGWAHALIYDIT